MYAYYVMSACAMSYTTPSDLEVIYKHPPREKTKLLRRSPINTPLLEKLCTPAT